MTNEEVVRQACKVVWSDGEISRAAEFYAEDFEGDYPFTEWGSGLQGVIALASQIREAFPDYRECIDELFTDGDDVIVRLTLRGTHTGPIAGMPPTGRQVEFRDVTICRVVDGKIVKQRGVTDYLSLYSQLGVIELPAPA